MNSRERVLAALNHREPDRVPVDFAGTDCSSVHVIAYDRLRRHLQLEPRPIRLGCLSQQIAEADTELLDQLGSDAVGLYFHPRKWRLWKDGYAFPLEVPDRWRPVREADGGDAVRDAKGEAVSRRAAGGLYFDPVSFPLAGVSSPRELDAHAALFERWDWPAVCDESVADYGRRAKKLRAGTDRAVVALWRMHYLQALQFLRGYEQGMVDLLTDEPLVEAILDRLHAVYLQRAKTFIQALDGAADIAFFTDDLGSQTGPMIGVDLYRRLFKPRWAELLGLVKKSGLKVLMHSCGAVADFIPDMIDVGVDALNPVQISAAGMEPARLKREFGKDISFWGGGVSTQGVLDQATPAQVREAVRRNVATFAKGGGYVFTPVHNLQANVPPENIVAAFAAATGK